MRRPHGFAAWLALIVAGGAALRLAHTLAVAPSVVLFGDSWFFHEVGGLVADGHGYLSPAPFIFDGEEKATAEHPPLFTFAVAALAKLGVGGEQAQRALLGTFLGGAAIAALGVLGARVGGERAGLAAAALAALYPTMIAADGALMSETLYGLLVALALICALGLARAPRLRGAAALGALVGLAALTRSEALLLLALLALPAAWLGGGARRAKLMRLGTACAAAAVVIAPWFARNLDAFERPVLISTNDGTALTGANCDATYRGARLGGFLTSCIPPVVHRDEGRQAAEWRGEALEYASDHSGRLPLVAAARFGRTWGLYRPWRQAEEVEGRRRWVQRLGVLAFYPLAALAVAGALALRRRRGELALLLAPLLLVSITAIGVYGTVRFRHAAEISLLVLAGVALASAKRPGRGPQAAAAPGARDD